MLRLKRSRHVKTGRTQARPWRIERRMGKLETLGFLGVWARRPLPKSVGSSRTKIKWVDQPQASNPFEIIHIRDTNSESFPTRWSQNRIGQAHFSLLTECDCLVDGFITDGNDYEMSLRTSEAWSCHDPLHATKTHLSNLRQVLRRFCGASPQW
jgi:hypothetical protein